MIKPNAALLSNALSDLFHIDTYRLEKLLSRHYLIYLRQKSLSRFVLIVFNTNGSYFGNLTIMFDVVFRIGELFCTGYAKSPVHRRSVGGGA